MTFPTDLERLLKEATEGPLTIDDCNADDVQRPNRFAGPVVVYADADCDTHPVADFSCNNTCRDAATAQANAALYALLHNHADAILGLVRDMERIAEWGCDEAERYDGTCASEIVRLAQSSLAKLNGGKG